MPPSNPTPTAEGTDLIDQLCDAIRRYGNAVVDWHNFREEKPSAPQEAEAASQRIMNLWRQMRDVLAKTPGVTYRDVQGARQDILRALYWGRRFLPMRVTVENEDTGEDEWSGLVDRDRAEIESLRAVDDLFHPVPGVDAGDLADPLRFGAYLHQLRGRLTSIRCFAHQNPADDFKPAQWFSVNTKIPPARLRQASRSGRKTKRVRKKTIDGVECYSVADARRWWASDMQKD